MPNKERRAAARRSQPNRKRNKGAGPSGIPATLPPDGDAGEHTATTSQTTSNTTGKSQPHPTFRRRTEDQTLVYRYVGAELQRILLFTGTIIVALVTLSFFLD